MAIAEAHTQTQHEQAMAELQKQYGEVNRLKSKNPFDVVDYYNVINSVPEIEPCSGIVIMNISYPEPSPVKKVKTDELD